MNHLLSTVSSARIARPTASLAQVIAFYVEDLGFSDLGGFTDHNGYDGRFVGIDGSSWHIEFTQHVDHVPTPTVEDLLVLYMPHASVDAAAAHMTSIGHTAIVHPNPYWAATHATTFLDPDGYCIVFCPED